MEYRPISELRMYLSADKQRNATTVKTGLNLTGLNNDNTVVNSGSDRDRPLPDRALSGPAGYAGRAWNQSTKAPLTDLELFRDFGTY